MQLREDRLEPVGGVLGVDEHQSSPLPAAISAIRALPEHTHMPASGRSDAASRAASVAGQGHSNRHVTAPNCP